MLTELIDEHDACAAAPRCRRCFTDIETHMHRYGIGIRRNHTDDILAGHYSLPVAEIVSENYIGRGGRMRQIREAAAANAGLCLHGVSLSLGSEDALDRTYLRALRELIDEVRPEVVSDHLSFARINGASSYDLWPVPMTVESVEHVAKRIGIVQDVLGRRIAIENVSSYLRYDIDVLSEAEFLNAVCETADCGLLLDVNNLYVNSVNHAFDARAALLDVDLHHVVQVHLAGHKTVWVDDTDSFLLDDHGSEPPDAVRALWLEVAPRLGPVPVILEWDEAPPSLPDMTEMVRQLERETTAVSTARHDGGVSMSGPMLRTTS